jgi:hypothetical protein
VFYSVGIVDGELQCDGAAIGVADDDDFVFCGDDVGEGVHDGL